MGVETRTPIINDRCREFNFTNEGGVAGTTRVLKNIAGLWLLQECRRAWLQEGANVDWEAMVDEAAAAPPLTALLNPDAEVFVAPRHMPSAIQAFCQETGQTAPQDRGAIVRCALESLALRYRMVLQFSEALTGAPIETIHIVGGRSTKQAALPDGRGCLSAAGLGRSCRGNRDR